MSLGKSTKISLFIRLLIKALTVSYYLAVSLKLVVSAIRARKTRIARVAIVVSWSVFCKSPRTHNLALYFTRYPSLSNLYLKIHTNGKMVDCVADLLVSLKVPRSFRWLNSLFAALMKNCL